MLDLSHWELERTARCLQDSAKSGIPGHQRAKDTQPASDCQQYTICVCKFTDGKKEVREEEAGYYRQQSHIRSQCCQKEHAAGDSPAKEQQTQRVIESLNIRAEECGETQRWHEQEAEGEEKATIRGEQSSGERMIPPEFPNAGDKLNEAAEENGRTDHYAHSSVESWYQEARKTCAHQGGRHGQGDQT